LTPADLTPIGPGLQISEDPNVFEASLRKRSDRSAKTMAKLMSTNREDVRSAAETVTQILKRFAKAIANSMENSSSVNNFLQALDVKLISRDHDWREVFTEIKSRGTGYEPHKQVLIIKYLQYLSARKRLLDTVLSRRAALEDTDGLVNVELTSNSGDGVGEMARTNEAASFGVPLRPGYERLQIGESVQLALPHESSLDLILAKHEFQLMGADPPRLVAPDGSAHDLKEGRSTVGRHPECDIVVDANFHDVSRVHLIIEWSREPLVKITDLSSLGTFVPTVTFNAWLNFIAD